MRRKLLNNLIILIFILVFGLSLFACGEKKKETETKKASKAQMPIVPGTAADETPARELPEVEKHMIKALQYVEDKRLDMAVYYYTKVLNQDPRRIEAYQGRGAAYATMLDVESALKDFNKAIELDPLDAASYFNKGRAYEIIGKNQEALEEYNLFFEIAPTNGDPEVIDNVTKIVDKLMRKIEKENALKTKK